MKGSSTAILLGFAAVALFSACGAPQSNEAHVQATSVSGQLLGTEVAVISIQELRRFVAGEDLAIFKDFLTDKQKESARRELGKVHRLAPERRAEAFASQTGKALIAKTRQLVVERNSAVNVPNTLSAAAADGNYTVLEFLASYPVDKLGVNFMPGGKTLVTVLIEMTNLMNTLEAQYGPDAR